MLVHVDFKLTHDTEFIASVGSTIFFNTHFMFSSLPTIVATGDAGFDFQVSKFSVATLSLELSPH